MIRKKILIAGSDGVGALEHFYIEGFKQLDLEVHLFDIQHALFKKLSRSILLRGLNRVYPSVLYREINDRLIQYTSALKPDIILVFKGLTLFPATISRLKKFARVIANYNPDHPYAFFYPGSGNQNIVESILLYDIHFSYSAEITKGLKARYGVEAATVPFGYSENLPASATGYANLSDKVIFVGSYDHERAQFISKLREDIAIYGNAEWSRGRNLHNAYQKKPLFGSELVAAQQNALACLNLLRKHNKVERSHNMRTFEVPGAGGVLLSERTDDQMSFFEDKKEAFFFSSNEELHDIIRFLKRTPNAVSQVKANAKERCARSNYSYFDRVIEMNSVLKKYF